MRLHVWCRTLDVTTASVMVIIYVTGDMIELLYLITTSEISQTGNCISIVTSY